MKYFILIAGFIASVTFVNAQKQVNAASMELGTIVSDPSSLGLDEVNKKLNLVPINDSKNTIEIRLYSSVGFPGMQCVVIEYDTKWKAFRSKINTKDSTVKQVLKPATPVDQVVKLLIARHVFSLPAQDKISKENYKLDLSANKVKMSAFVVSDAPCYYIQFKAGEQLREYKYCDPKGNAAFYKYQQEYADVVAILKQFSKLEGR